MARSHIVFFTLVLSVTCSIGSDVPVFLWGDLAQTSLKSNPLSSVTPDEFSGILKEEIKDDPFTVVFLEESLSVEDLSRKDAEGNTLFPYLHANLGDSYYLPSVEHALRVINEIADSKNVNHVKLTDNGLSADISTTSGRFLIINLNDVREGESRSDMLRRHNDFMEEMYSKLQERYDSVVAIYTAHNPSWIVPETHSRVRRQAELTATEQDLVLDGLRLFAEEIMYSDINTQKRFTVLTSHSSSFNETIMNTTLTFGNEDTTLTLNFRNSRGYWFFESVNIEQTSNNVNELLTPTAEEVFALSNFSYRCAQVISFGAVNDTKKFTVIFNNSKIQPFFESRNASFMEFGESVNCVGFFSVPIWSCLFVVFILLAITFYGIMMMMDIRTMDRFDDPKGKTITINAVGE